MNSRNQTIEYLNGEMKIENYKSHWGLNNLETNGELRNLTDQLQQVVQNNGYIDLPNRIKVFSQFLSENFITFLLYVYCVTEGISRVPCKFMEHSSIFLGQ